MLAALSRIDGVARDQQHAIRAALLDEMLEPHPPLVRPALAARAASLGIDFAIPARVVLIDRRNGGEAELDDAFVRLTGALAERSVAQLATRRSGTVAAPVQASHSDLRADLARLADGLPDVVVGSVTGVRPERGARLLSRRADRGAVP